MAEQPPSVDPQMDIELEQIKLEAVFKHASAALAIVRGPNAIFEKANASYLKLFPGRSLIGRPLLEGLPELEGQKFPLLLAQVFETGIPYYENEARAFLRQSDESPLEEKIFDQSYTRIDDAQGKPYAVLIHAIDITERVVAREVSSIKTLALELTLKEAPLQSVLELIVNLIESQLGGGRLASILLLDQETQRVHSGATASLPDEFNRAIEGVRVGPEIGSCGRAATLGIQVIVADILTDPLWKDFKALAEKNNLRSCTSTPIVSSRGKVLGTFALYHHQPGIPTARDQQLIDLAAQTSAIVIERNLEVTRRHAAEQEARAAAKEITDVLEGMSEAFFKVDENWIFQSVNAQCEKALKSKREDIIGKSLIDDYLSTPEQKESLYYKNYKSVMETRKPAYFIDHYEPLNVWTAVAAYPHSGGGMAVFFREISAEREAALKLEQAVSSRDEFLSIASHELRTPITGMKLQMQMMERSIARQDQNALSPGKIANLIRQTNQGLDRMSRLVDDMLDISRIQAGKLSLQLESSNLVVLLKEIADRFSEQLQGAHIPLQVETKIPQIFVPIDRFRIEQVFTNLITNAIRYAPNAPAKITLESQSADFVTLSFEDAGPGIALEDRERVFDRFERLISPNEISGFGLGLYIVKQIILAHGGAIRVEDAQPGARFIIDLPLKR